MRSESQGFTLVYYLLVPVLVENSVNNSLETGPETALLADLVQLGVNVYNEGGCRS